MTYKEARQYLKEISKTGSIPGLESVKNLAEVFGNPQKDLTIIHLGGTNGKGSTLAFLRAMFLKAGYKVGNFSTPAVFDYEEQFQINGENMKPEDLATYVGKMKEGIQKLLTAGKRAPTVFEVETVLSFLYFKEQKCDVVLLEVGMGGAMDATNIIEFPLACIFTPISMDHMNFLGNSLEEIAKEKSGIIKAGAKVISAPQKASVIKILKEKAKAKTDDFYLVKEELIDKMSEKKLALSGLYQNINAATAVTAATLLRSFFTKLDEDAIEQGLLAANWPGRFETILDTPRFIIDGAHNPDGAKALAKSLKFYFTNKRIIYIMGVLRDKEYQTMLKETVPLADEVMTITTPTVRGFDGRELLKEVKKYKENAIYVESIDKAVKRALTLAGKEDIIIAFGSLTFLGEVKKAIEK
ncbi:MAG TPA: bifunctional folylpolyglutamate synthase/dihydrofolate synthase [Candidatus Dorea intestinavium]|nr:bifunctional folylpolyglutamate synthase/dihydrofolate synthase [Candidatus Dorea intestinavium]